MGPRAASRRASTAPGPVAGGSSARSRIRSAAPGRNGESAPFWRLKRPIFTFRAYFVSNNFANIVSLSSVRETSNADARPLLSGEISSFLDYCKVEKGLATNTLEAYSRDLKALAGFPKLENSVPGLEDLRLYLDSLYGTGLGSRSIARHMATLRNFYRFLASNGKIESDPTERLVAPKQWQNIPKFLNREEIDRLLTAPDMAKPSGVRDRAMLELLY